MSRERHLRDGQEERAFWCVQRCLEPASVRHAGARNIAPPTGCGRLDHATLLGSRQLSLDLVRDAPRMTRLIFSLAPRTGRDNPHGACTLPTVRIWH